MPQQTVGSRREEIFALISTTIHAVSRAGANEMNRGILTIGATKEKTRVPREQRKRETSKKRGQGKHLEEVTS